MPKSHKYKLSNAFSCTTRDDTLLNIKLIDFRWTPVTMFLQFILLGYISEGQTCNSSVHFYFAD